MRASVERRQKDDIVAGLIERPMRGVSELRVLQDVARLKANIAKLESFMPSIKHRVAHKAEHQRW